MKVIRVDWRLEVKKVLVCGNETGEILLAD